jgi:nucleotide-binding universal stress UspA family protein
MKTILVPTDFSARSENALQYALLLARKIKAHLLVYHVHYFPLEYVYADETQTSGRQNAQLRMERLVYRVEQQNGVLVESLMESGLALERITHLVKSREIDLIVMGTRGHSPTPDEPLGSLTWALIQECICPVLAIPEHCHYQPIDSILLAADHKSSRPEYTFQLLSELISAFKAKFNILHLQADLERLTLAQQETDRQLESYFLYDDLYFHFTTNDSLFRTLEEFMAEEAISLLVMINRQQSYLQELYHRNIGRNEALHQCIPLLVLPEINQVA